MINEHRLVRFGAEAVDGQAVEAEREHRVVDVVYDELGVVRTTVLTAQETLPQCLGVGGCATVEEDATHRVVRVGLVVVV